MSCGSCSSGSCNSGCGSKTAQAGTSLGCQNNGTCGTSGCNKMNVFDWLGNMELPRNQRFNIVEIRFKGNRKEFFRKPPELELFTGDAVVVEISNGGYHVGYVSLQGELVRLQMSRKKVRDDNEIKRVYRLATPKDLERLQEFKNKEMAILYRTRKIVEEIKLDMKVSDVEFQADGTKATFYYSAEDRVDFRELIKSLASEFKIRVEMRQISLRQEAGRLGGIGACGRELCCSTWLTDFKSVSTAAARYQNLSLNPSKLSGQCGRLKCCLNYELQTYLDALVDIPKVETPLLTDRGNAYLQKTDIFRKMMWFAYDQESIWHPLPVDRVSEILALNAAGKTVESLKLDIRKPITSPVDFKNDLSFNSKDQKNINQKRDHKRKNNQDRNRDFNKNPRPEQPVRRENLNQTLNPNQRPIQKIGISTEEKQKLEIVVPAENILTLEQINQRFVEKPLTVEKDQVEKRKRKRRRKRKPTNPSQNTANQELKQENSPEISAEDRLKIRRERPILEIPKSVIGTEKPVFTDKVETENPPAKEGFKRKFNKNKRFNNKKRNFPPKNTPPTE